MKKQNSNSPTDKTVKQPDKGIVKKPESNHVQNTSQPYGTKNEIEKTENNLQTKNYSPWDSFKSWWQKEGAPDRIMVVLTLAIVLLTFPTVYFNCSQIKQSERFSIIEARAYIRYDVVKSFSRWSIGKQGAILSAITNVGKTPAYNEFSISHIKFGKVKEEEIQIIEHPANNGASMGAGETKNIEACTDTALTAEDTLKLFRSVINKDSTLFVYGIIYYEDAFGGYHWTRYCMGYQYDMDRFFINDKFNDCDNNE